MFSTLVADLVSLHPYVYLSFAVSSKRISTRPADATVHCRTSQHCWMSSAGRAGGLCASTSREDLPRSRNNSARRAGSGPSEALSGVLNTSDLRGYGCRGRRRYVRRYDSPVIIRAVIIVDKTIQTMQERQDIVEEAGDELDIAQKCTVTIEEQDPLEDNMPSYPGFVFNPVTRKHFRIAGDHSGTYLGSSGEHVKGCQFLELVGNDDERMLGCWAIGDGSRNSRIGAKLACLKAKLDDDAAEKVAMKLDQIYSRVSGEPPENTLGLEFVLDGESVDISQPVLVDMTVAPVDSDVTCVLYVTAESRLTGIGISSMCKVVLQPLPALCLDGDDFEVRDSPIYNIRWSVESSAIYSCAWNSNKTRIALGMEEAAKIMDVITEKSFMISSRRRNVISQHFSSDGDVIFMGLRDSDVILSDLRMKSHHVIGTLKGSRSSGWIKQLRMSYPQCIMIENFRGESAVTVVHVDGRCRQGCNYVQFLVLAQWTIAQTSHEWCTRLRGAVEPEAQL
ncbi:unnamed protein product [Angiostrongylus costaricensis]|uniref:PPM-type phosphatase domain-containing protein n=1 Tax=Angiostrongylus costaricensis TaxID=334426 RepID=A0A0R3PX35_ANGCS|nr:unnamed protein product [Angiostrongylus costaricensis]